MSITAMRTKLSGNALAAILIIGGLAILLPIFFSGAGGGKRSREDAARQQALDDQREVVARVGKDPITRGEVNALFDQFAAMQGNREITPIQRHQSLPGVLDSLRDQVILTAAAREKNVKVSGAELRAAMDEQVKVESERLGVAAIANKAERRQYEANVRADVQGRSEEIRRGLLVQKVTDDLKKAVSLDSKGLKDGDVEVSARHILITWKGLGNAAPEVKRTKAEAKALAEKIATEARQNPNGFPALADKYTEDQSGKGNGGDLGFFTRERMVKPFSDAAFAAKPGSVVGPVASQFGYHVIKVEDRRVSDARALQEVQKFLEEKRKTAKLEVIAPDFKAAKAYETFVTEPPKDEKAKEAKRKELITAYEVAAKARPTDAALFARIGQLYREDKETDKAIAAYQQAAALPRPSADIHMALGDLYREKKQNKEALHHYGAAGRLASNDMMTHLMLQMAYHDMGEKQLAEQESAKLRGMQQSQGMPGGMPMTIPGG